MIDISNITIPHTAGVYLMKDGNKKIIYIGKAKYLPARVKSYFNNTPKQSKTIEMVSKIDSIDFVVTENEIEALLLEARLIKQYKPQYNIMLKDNTPYMYIKITNEEYPQILSTRRIEKDNALYFGPYVYGQARKQIIITTARLFGLRTGKLTSKSAKELHHLLSNKNGNIVSKKKYNNNVQMAKLFLRGKKDKVLKYLENKLNTASNTQNFELAKLYSKQIESIKQLDSKQLISLPKKYDQNIINYVQDNKKVIFQVFKVVKGVVSSKKQYILENNEDILYHFIKQYYLTKSIPKEIIVPHIFQDKNTMEKYLEKLKGSKAYITIPKKGDKKKLLELVRKNILINIENQSEKELMDALKLTKLPIDIEGFDISNISGQLAVGSCVHFTNSTPNKKLYKKFKIKTVNNGPDDYAMMNEVLFRRFSHNEWKFPDLILIDGGPGQLSSAYEALKKLGIDVPIISLAKKNEEIYTLSSNAPVVLSKKSKALKLLQYVRDESHRFAIKYHRTLRSKR